MKAKYIIMSLFLLYFLLISCSDTDGVMVILQNEGTDTSTDKRLNIYNLDNDIVQQINSELININKNPFKIFIRASTSKKFVIQVYRCNENELTYISERQFIHNGGYQEENYILEQRCGIKDECLLPDTNLIPQPDCSNNPDQDAQVDSDADSDADADTDTDTDTDTDADTDTDTDTDSDSDVETCIDEDGDNYGINCPSGSDCDDTSNLCTDNCADMDNDNIYDCKDSCIDEDGDNYGLDTGLGDGCMGFDCDDTNTQIYLNAPRQCNELSLDYDCNGFIDNTEGCTALCSNGPPFGAITPVNSIQVSNTINKIFVAGNYAYLAVNDPTNSLTIVDINNSKIIGSVAVNTGGNDLVVYNNYVYMVTNLINNNGLHVIDVSQPSNPSTPISFNTNFDARTIYYYSKNLFIGEGIGNNNTEVFSIQEQQNPAVIAEGNNSSSPMNDIVTVDPEGIEYIIAAEANTLKLMQRNGATIDLLNTLTFTNSINSIYYYKPGEKIFTANNAIRSCQISNSQIECLNINNFSGINIIDIVVKDGINFLLGLYASGAGVIGTTKSFSSTQLTSSQNLPSGCSTMFVTDTNIFIGCEDTLFINNITCCYSDSQTCSLDEQCCGGTCTVYNTCCLSLGSSCTTDSRCCNQNCSSYYDICCNMVGEQCNTNTDCCTQICDTEQYVCACKANYTQCRDDEECCSHNCVGFCM